MATAKKQKGNSESYSKSSRCWPGYEPVPGKSEHQEGSCRKKPASRNGGEDVDRETARQKQMALGGKRAEQARSKSPSAAERRKAREKAAGTSGRRTGAKPTAKSASAGTHARKTSARGRAHRQEA